MMLIIYYYKLADPLKTIIFKDESDQNVPRVGEQIKFEKELRTVEQVRYDLDTNTIEVRLSTESTLIW